MGAGHDRALTHPHGFSDIFDGKQFFGAQFIWVNVTRNTIAACIVVFTVSSLHCIYLFHRNVARIPNPFKVGRNCHPPVLVL